MSLAENNRLIATQWFDAFNRHALEDLLNLYDNNAQHKSPKLKLRQPETQGLVSGKAALRAWWKDSFDRLPTLQYLPINIVANDELVMMEYMRKVTGEEDMLVAELLEIAEGKIIRSRVFHG